MFSTPDLSLSPCHTHTRGAGTFVRARCRDFYDFRNHRPVGDSESINSISITQQQIGHTRWSGPDRWRTFQPSRLS
jgi:hypothetical protein